MDDVLPLFSLNLLHFAHFYQKSTRFFEFLKSSRFYFTEFKNLVHNTVANAVECSTTHSIAVRYSSTVASQHENTIVFMNNELITANLADELS